MATFNNIPNIFTNNANIEELREEALQHTNSARSVDLILSSTKEQLQQILVDTYIASHSNSAKAVQELYDYTANISRTNSSYSLQKKEILEQIHETCETIKDSPKILESSREFLRQTYCFLQVSWSNQNSNKELSSQAEEISENTLSYVNSNFDIYSFTNQIHQILEYSQPTQSTETSITSEEILSPPHTNIHKKNNKRKVRPRSQEKATELCKKYKSKAIKQAFKELSCLHMKKLDEKSLYCLLEILNFVQTDFLPDNFKILCQFFRLALLLKLFSICGIIDSTNNKENNNQNPNQSRR